jgi:ketosteroid isomerase-like protein
MCPYNAAALEWLSSYTAGAGESERFDMAGIYQSSEELPQLFYQALRQVMEGDISPMLALWSTLEDITYVDPAGQLHQGPDGIATYWRQAAKRNAEASSKVLATADLISMHASGGLVCTVMAEHIWISQPSGRLVQMKAVSTNIYRYQDCSTNCEIHSG